MDFDKWLASLRYRHYWRGLGESQLYVEAGTISGEVPLPYLEAGLVIDNIIRVNYLNVAWVGLGVGAYRSIRRSTSSWRLDGK